MGIKFITTAFKLEMPAQLRDEFDMLAADHLRGQARLVFIGFILSLPMVFLVRAPAAPAWVGFGLPLLILAMSLFGLRLLREIPLLPDAARRMMRRIWLISLAIASTGSLWALLSWYHSPVDERVYYVAIMIIGALTLGYTLTASRLAGLSTLIVTLLPISMALLTTDLLLEKALAAGLLIAIGAQILLVGRHHRLLLALVEERRHSHDLARIDPLTGIANRRALLEEAEELGRKGRIVRLLLVDIDRFKGVNDRYGHGTGDEILMIVATLLSDHASGEIHAARLGGEEFALLGPVEAVGPDLADAFLEAVRTAEMPHGETLTASIGAATGLLDGRDDWSQLYGRADRALYVAKDAGRDRAVELPVQQQGAEDLAEQSPRETVRLRA